MKVVHHLVKGGKGLLLRLQHRLVQRGQASCTLKADRALAADDQLFAAVVAVVAGVLDRDAQPSQRGQHDLVIVHGQHVGALGQKAAARVQQPVRRAVEKAHVELGFGQHQLGRGVQAHVGQLVARVLARPASARPGRCCAGCRWPPGTHRPGPAAPQTR